MSTANNTKPERAQFAHGIHIPVRWGDMDALGHVNIARYFTFDEQTRLQYFEKMPEVIPDFWNSIGLILARNSCDFLAQVHYPATLEVCYRISKIGRTSMQAEGAMFDQTGKLVAITNGVIVWFDFKANKPSPIPEVAKSWIRAREIIAPLEA